MKKIVLALTLIFFSLYLFAGKPVTHYYTQLKVVSKDGKEMKGNNRGQFITFNEKGCYDSDRSGYTVDNGFLKYGATSNGKVYYRGNSYWGVATYIFTENYGRLNIRVENDGSTYVYVLASPPKNILTCALIKKPISNTTNSPISIIVSPATPAASSSNSTRKQCPGCNGTKKGMDQITYSPNYTGGNNNRYCSQCGSTSASHTHNTPICKVCYGKGYVE
ncbi:hypothetical protein CLV62_1171 [Dysgonomonas alginatilytica]|uniref:DnaJ-like protein n=1 Tax=Dysgonomonas alginatilytica TaxID=1605892 RepID=A0A2V3PLW1_9BACT|nr:hypothetical protein [Dysgonomonas alginatilytica]PXV62785.1 hypothetical protein CLV62_1171 [Dysgonomonas alginatilytica]